MPGTPTRSIDDPTDPEFSWKSGGGGGGSSRFNPPGAGIGGSGGVGGSGGIGFDYRPTEGFDPMNEVRRRRLAMAFGKGGMRPGLRLGGQQPMGPARIDPQMLQRLFAMFGGGGG